MTSDCQHTELLRPEGPTNNGVLTSFKLQGSRRRSKRQDFGLWLLTGQGRRDAMWLQLKNEYEQSPLLLACNRPVYDTIRRAGDVIGSLFFFALFAPLLLVLAAWIRLESPGPAFFRQWRVGRSGRLFVIWKLRTMYTTASAYSRSPLHTRDRRVTPSGNFLRRTSLDELPQLLNVFRGEMSLIGPRPEMPYIARRYTLLERQRLIIRPGMTGLWQVGPGRSAPIHQNLECDLHYILRRNLLMDLAILLRTAVVVLKPTS